MNTQRVLRPNFKKRGGLVTVVAQDAFTREVLMVAYTDEAGYLETLKTGDAVYFSTSRNKRWKKGDESGDVQKIKGILVDCDGDALIYLVDQEGQGACHTKARSCFYRNVIDGRMLMEAPNADQADELPMIETEVAVDADDEAIKKHFFAIAKIRGIPLETAEEFWRAGR
jgi:phosphoribosyl-AMP cyclohydrolase